MIKKKIIFGFFLLLSFIIVFIFIIRLSRIYYNNYIVLDLKKYLFIFEYIGFFISIIIIIVIYNVLVSIKKYSVAYLKIHFLNFYFYYCRDISLYFQYFSFFDELILKFFPKWIHVYIIFFFRYFLKICVAFFFFKNILFDDFCIDLFLIPYYGIYYLIINIMDFFKKFKIDFDQGFCMQLRKITICVNTGYVKLYEYQKYLINNFSRFKFFNDYENIPVHLNQPVYFFS